MPFRDWVRLLFDPQRRGERRLISLAAYMDDSESHDKRFVAEGACVSTVAAWTAFHAPWRQALKKCRVDEFHMTDYNSRKQPPYDEKSMTRDEWDMLMKNLVSIMVEHVDFFCGIVVARDDFAQMPREFIKRHKKPEVFVATSCMWMACRYLSSIDKPTQIAFTHEIGRNKKQQGDLADVIEATRKDVELRRFLAPLSIDTKKSPPLQAADIIANEVARHSPRFKGFIENGLPFSLRTSLDQLGKIPNQSVYFTAKTLKEFCDFETDPSAPLTKLAQYSFSKEAPPRIKRPK
jgi:hypothetical protein